MDTCEEFCDSLCRTCMSRLAALPSSAGATTTRTNIKPEQQWQSIFTKIEECNALRIAELLSNTIPRIEVQLRDELPKKICCKCLKQLQSVYRFQQECLKSQHELREMIAKRNANLNASSKEYIRVKEVSTHELSVLDFIPETTKQSMEFASLKTLPVAEYTDTSDPLSGGIEHNRNIRGVDVVDFVENEITSDEHDAEYSDNETLLSTVGDKNDVIIRDIDMEQVNFISPSHICSVCNNSFNSPQDLNNHLKSHKKTNTTKNEIHEQSANEIHNFMCKICNRCFKKEKSLNKHRLVHDDNNKTNGKVQSYPCDLCKKTYTSNFTLERHKKLRHSTAQAAKETPKSNPTESTSREQHVARKPKPEKTIKSLACTFCDKVCKNACALRHHIRRHTTERVLCPECGKSFSCEGNLKMHLLRHRDDKPYECPHCPRRFPCISDLANHKRIHEAKRHICNICGAAFTQPYELKNHNKHHSGEKPFKCDFCEKCFARHDQQKRHMRTHTGEKPFKCRYCERAFAQSNDHVKHLRIHLGDNIYRCDLCPLAFRLASLRRSHYATHKNDDAETRERNLQALKEEEEKLAKLAVE